MARRPLLVVFLGDLDGTEVERMVSGARVAAALDTIEAALATEAFSGAVVVTDSADLEVELPGVTVDRDSVPYHFGERLAGVVGQHEAVLYLGRRERAAACRGRAGFDGEPGGFGIGGDEQCVLERRGFVSGDAGGAGGNSRLESRQRAGVGHCWTRGCRSKRYRGRRRRSSTSTRRRTSRCWRWRGAGGERLRGYASSLGMDVSRYERVLPLFMDNDAQIVVAGRVGSHAWAYLERETACRVRLFAEERGMAAEGRDEAARSLVGYYIEAVGIERFFETLAELGDAAFIDTRVLLAHMGIEASRADRFNSDLGRWDEVGEPWLREFTRGAVEATVPVLLGGHSLMSGGLMVLNERAWRLRDAGKL